MRFKQTDSQEEVEDLASDDAEQQLVRISSTISGCHVFWRFDLVFLRASMVEIRNRNHDIDCLFHNVKFQNVR